MSVRNYNYSLRNNPEERSSQVYTDFVKTAMNFRMRILVTVGKYVYETRGGYNWL